MNRVDRSQPGRQKTMSTDLTGRIRDRAATLGFLALLVAFIGLVLVPGWQLANRLSTETAALKLASEHRSQPEAMANDLSAIRDRLGSGAYVGQALRELDATMHELDSALAQLEHTSAADSRAWREARTLWPQYRRYLEPVVSFKGLPYRDSDTGGAEMTPGGRRLLGDTRRAVQASHDSGQKLTAALTAVGTQLEDGIASGSATLRMLMLTGVAFACALVALLAYFQWLKARHEQVAIEARNQTRDILSTVKDGLCLIDADFRIGSTRSAALSTLFRRERFDGLYFEDMLRDLVPEKTLVTAMKYVKLLWGERVNENLIRSINPLSEVEVQFDRDDGQQDTRYLEFDFHRVKGDEGLRHVLVSVNDVTSRVMLARELKESQANAQVQMDMLLGLLQVDPHQLTSFLDESGAALGHVNSVLKVPARGDLEFRDKIDKVFREIHRLKGEASALGLTTVESRAHSFEDMLSGLRDRQQLSGSDFLPLVVRLDEILSHLQSIKDLAGRLDGLRATAILSPTPAAAEQPDPARTVPDLSSSLEGLAIRIAGDRGKQVRLVTAGLDQVPGDYRKAVRDVVIQLIRNAVVHGVESPDARNSVGKDPTGVLQLQFRPRDQGFELVFQDDGAGIVADRVRDAALRRGTITAEEAQALDTKATLALVFRSGFSTYEGSDRDAGRGVGLDFVLKCVQALGGRIGVATAPGKYTRFSITLPAETVRQGAVA